MPVIKRENDRLVLRARIQTNARTNKWSTISDTEAVIKLTALPVDGRANAALIKFLSKEFGTPISRIKIHKGLSSQRKLIHIEQARKIPLEIEKR